MRIYLLANVLTYINVDNRGKERLVLASAIAALLICKVRLPEMLGAISHTVCSMFFSNARISSQT